jgi:hypothetical protein
MSGNCQNISGSGMLRQRVRATASSCRATPPRWIPPTSKRKSKPTSRPLASRSRSSKQRSGTWWPLKRRPGARRPVLLKRGQKLVAVGDLASARVVPRRAAEAREPRAALALASTYDPIVLEKLAVYGLEADISLAWSWYEKAKEFGSEDAPRRLEMLAGREQ